MSEISPNHLVEMVVTVKDGISDPVSRKYEADLLALGFPIEPGSVVAGSYFQILMDSTDRNAAMEEVASMGEKLLANQFSEEFEILPESSLPRIWHISNPTSRQSSGH